MIKSTECLSKWCILRTSGARTLGLADSLAKAGFEVWTPRQVVQAREQRGRRAQPEHEVAICPTFVFARACHLVELSMIRSLPASPHPDFSIFHSVRGIPLIADRDIAGLRRAEERAQREAKKTERHVFPIGAKVQTSEGGFGGLTGVVEEGDDRIAVVNFGGRLRVKIATWLLQTDTVKKPPSPE